MKSDSLRVMCMCIIFLIVASF